MAKTPNVPSGTAALSNGTKYGPMKGHKVTKLPTAGSRNQKKYTVGKSKQLVRGVIREVAGLAPYEKKIIDLIKVYGGGADKKVYKLAKKRLGSHKRAISKREGLKNLYSEMRNK